MAGALKVLTGFILAIAIIAGGGYFAAQYLIAKFTELPPRPTFPNDNSSPSPPPTQAKPRATATSPAPVTTSPEDKSIPAPSPSESPEAAPSPSTSPSATATQYQARVVLNDGLNVRESPDGERIGGVDYNQSVTVLETSPDQGWIKIKTEAGLEGWIKAGYTEKIESAQ